MIISPSVRAISEIMTAHTYGTGTSDPSPSLRDPSVAGLTDGSFVIVWVSEEQDGFGDGVFGQRFDASGNRLGAEFQVNTVTLFSQNQPAVTPTADGGFFVVWTSYDGIYGQKFDADGERVGGEQQISLDSVRQSEADIVSFEDGSIFVAWTADEDIHGRSFSSAGEALSTEFQLNDDSEYSQFGVSLAALDAISFAASWGSNGQLLTRSFETLAGSPNPQAVVVGVANVGSTDTVKIDSNSYFSIGSANFNNGSVSQGQTKFGRVERSGEILGEALGTWNGVSASGLLTSDGELELILDEYHHYYNPSTPIISEPYYGLREVRVSDYAREIAVQDTRFSTQSRIKSDSEMLGDGTFVVAWAAAAGGTQVNFQRFVLNQFPEGELNISGTALTSFMLTAELVDLSDADGIGPLSYQWFRVNGPNSSEAIPEATSSEYLLKSEDVGKRLFVQLSYIDGAGTEELFRSEMTGSVGIFQEGTSGDDRITGGTTNDQLFGLVGSDTLIGMGGNDTLDGGVGDDVLRGTGQLLGGDGNDQLRIESYSDAPWPYFVSFAQGGAGNDTIVGSGSLDGGEGDDNIYAYGGNDTLFGGEGLDQLFGEGGDDILRPGIGQDSLSTGLGADLIAGSGDDLLDDLLLDFTPSDAVIVENATLYGDPLWTFDGTRTKLSSDFSGDGNREFSIYFTGDLSGVEIDVFQSGADVWVGARVLEGTIGDDTITGNLLDNVIRGFAGNDWLHGVGGADAIDGGASNDYLSGGEGDDRLAGGPGEDSLYGDDGNDSLNGGFDNDRIEGGEGDDNIEGGDGDDYLSGGEGDDSLAGGPGEDSLYGDDGNDSLNGGFDNDRIEGGEGDDIIEGGDGNDYLSGGEGDDSLAGGPGEDSLYGDDGNDSLLGGAGGDRLNGGAGNDLVDGGADDDRIEGGEGGDNLVGGEGSDAIWGDAGNDFVNGGEGADHLIGGDGDDTIIGGLSDTDLRDVIYAGEGNDSVNGGYGNDLIFGMEGNDTIAGGAGADDLRGQDGDDVITGSAYSDVIYGNAGNDFVNGGYGSDRINGGTGADRFFHVGVEGHGSDWVQDYSSAEGDVLLFGNEMATRNQFQVNFAHTANSEGERSGDDAVQEAFVIYRPTGQIMWALVDGEGQDSINLKIGDEVFDLLG
ncbi:calcium-binding protein [Ruegeria sp. PrR005]|uniref:Calcium-binding protein n=1 Tax=Ruegeria sp. PrR005 TaxID=2706882 RepID=A0A6B2NN84_9RHOB|nr:calcium-binding protein [Ruegeria sp. PrR005]NDW45566.1 calcium-binding protein [Ruegeria sp. PrR005]